MLTQDQINKLVNDKNIVKINVKMTEYDYITSMINDLEKRMFEINPKLEIKWLSYNKFVNDILSSGLDMWVNINDGDIEINFTNEYCKYIDKCAKKIYTLEEFCQSSNVIDLTKL